MANPGLSELATMTLRNRSGILRDNVTENVMLLKRLNEKGNVKPADGGRTIIQEMEYAENSTYTRFSGYETINITPSDVFTAAEFNWSQAAGAVTISGLERIQNSGSGKSIDLLKSRIKNLEKTLQNNVGADTYSDGTADGGRQIGGLQLLVSSTPTTGTVGGIDRSTTAGTFWRNKVYKATTDGGAAATSANIVSYMNRLWVQLTRNKEKPDLILADNNYFLLYLEAMQGKQQIMVNSSLADAGFQNLKFNGADVVLDGGYGGSCPSNTMYFLNSDYLYWRPHPDYNFTVLGGERESTNQDAMVKLVGVAGQMTMSNAFMQGVLINT